MRHDGGGKAGVHVKQQCSCGGGLIGGVVAARIAGAKTVAVCSLSMRHIGGEMVVRENGVEAWRW